MINSGCEGHLTEIKDSIQITEDLTGNQRDLCLNWCRANADLGWFEGVICGEMDGEEEDAALVRAVRLQQDTQTRRIRRPLGAELTAVPSPGATEAVWWAELLPEWCHVIQKRRIFWILTGPMMVACQ